jgi:hypothetical protein
VKVGAVLGFGVELEDEAKRVGAEGGYSMTNGVNRSLLTSS